MTELIVRQSDVMNYLSCPQKYLRDKEKRGRPHTAAVGGITIATLIDHYLKGSDLPTNPEAAARMALSIELTNLSRNSPVDYSSDDLSFLVGRIADVYENFVEWWDSFCRRNKVDVIATELEFRNRISKTVTISGRLDCVLVVNDALCSLDWKSHLCWGKSLQAQNAIPRMSEEIQLGWYDYAFSDGAILFKDCTSADRHTSTDELVKSRDNISLSVGTPDKHVIVEVGQTVPFVRGDKKGKLRGDVWYEYPVTGHLKRSAKELVDWFVWATCSGLHPRTKRYMGQGKTNCDSCAHRKTCWPKHDTPQPRHMPDFLRGK